MNDTLTKDSALHSESPANPQRYRLGEVLGRGGMATVYRAFDTQTGREVAIKVLYEHLREHPIIVEHFRREVSIAQQLEHPHIVRIYSLLETPEMLGIVMELHGHSDLKEHLQRHGPMPREQVVEIGTQVLSALHTAHQLGIVHQDIKPHNILWDPTNRIAKLIDFGLAETDEIIALARPESAMGTVEYSAPEQFDDFSTDARADLYSLGITLFELLSGSLPYRSETAAGVIQMHREAPLADIRVFVRGIPAHIAETLLRAMAKIPEDRFENAHEMSRALSGKASRELAKPARSQLWENLKNNHETNPKPANWNIYIAATDVISMSTDGSPNSQDSRAHIIQILKNHTENLRPDLKAIVDYDRNYDLAIETRIGEVLDSQLNAYNIKNPSAYALALHGMNAHKNKSEVFPLACNLTFEEAEEIRYELGRNSIISKCFQHTILTKNSKDYPELITKWNRAVRFNRKAKAALENMTLMMGIGLLLFYFSANFISTIRDELAGLPFLFFGLIIAIAVAMIPLHFALKIFRFNDTWALGKLLFEENYVLQFNQNKNQPLESDLVKEQHAALYHSLRSNRVRATYDRIVLTLLDLSQKSGTREQIATVLAQTTDITTRISELENRLTTQNQATVFEQLARLDAQLLQSEDTHQTAELIEQKTALYQQLSQVDADRTELKNLSHKLLQVAANLDDLHPATLQITGRV